MTAAQRIPNSEDIPFFNTLPDAAVPLAARLWDTIRQPGFNSVPAYKAFSEALSLKKIDAPTRPVFKRWVAGVQADLIDRPGDPRHGEYDQGGPVEAGTAEAGQTATFVDTLPEAAHAALQAAWDKADAGHFSDRHIYECLMRDIIHVGHRPPPRAEIVEWLAAVRAGAVERPAKQITENKPDAEAADQPSSRTFTSDKELATWTLERSRDFEARAVVLPIMPDDRAMRDMPQDDDKGGDEGGAALVAIRCAAGRLVEDLISQLSADIEKTARAHAARMLRDMADELGAGQMEGGAIMSADGPRRHGELQHADAERLAELQRQAARRQF